jgi:hypothetical protein
MKTKTVGLFEAAMASLKSDILDLIKEREGSEAMPCLYGTRAFGRQVETYWKLIDLLTPLGVETPEGAQPRLAVGMEEPEMPEMPEGAFQPSRTLGERRR